MRRCRCGEARLVRPEIAADHFELGLERRAVDAHALDRARRRALAAGDLRPLERGAGRRGAGEQPLAIAEHDLGVGADVDQKGQFVLEMGTLGEHDACGVGADMAGDAGQRIDEGAGRNIEAEFARTRFVSRVEGKRERRPAELGRVEAKHEVMHDRVADQRHFQDFVACDPGLARGFANQRVHRLAHHARQLLVAARVHHHVGDPAHQIFAEADLRVHRPDRRDDLAAREIGEVGGDGGRTDIDGDAKGAVGEARHDGDDVASFAQSDGDLPLPRAQRLLQTSERREIGMRFVEIPLLAQSLLEAAKIARRLVHVRLGDLDVIETDDRIDLDRMRLGALADDLPMNLTFGRHVDDEIAANFCLAAEPAAGRKRSALRGIAGLDGSRRRRMIGTGTDGVLGEVAFCDVDLTAAANASPATNRIEIDAERARGLEQT